MTTIHVTQKHINAGVKKQCTSCPVALALQDHFDNKDLWAGPSDFLTPTGCADTPEVVREFMNRFDAGDFVSPFSFEIPNDQS